MSTPQIEGQRRALVKRGFKKDDVYFHTCTGCGEKAIEKYTLQGRLGGRDIDLCIACGGAWSWSRRGGVEEREVDIAFDLVTFLR